MEGFFATVVVMSAMFASLAFFRRVFDRAEMPLVQFSVVAHILSVFAQVWITRDVYGIGDMLEYWRSGVEIATAMRYDFALITPEVVKLIFQQEPRFPFEIFAGGPATGSMLGISSIIFFFVGESLHAAAMVISFGAFLGKVSIYIGLRAAFPRHLHTRLLIATLLIPSVVFWSSGILKESVAILGVGLMFVALHSFEQRHYVRSALFIAFGALIVGLVKPYILFPFSVATGVWLYWTRASRSGSPVVVKPVYLALGAGVAAGGIIALGQLFPSYAVDRLGESTANIQAAGERVDGGSFYQIADPSTRSLSGQLMYAPLALATALFRPLLFEARNFQMALNALETTVLMLLFLRTVAQRSWSEVKTTVTRSPMLMFCLVFSMSLAVAVGLASTNLGTLSRYRMPLVPFFAALLLIVSARRAPSEAPSLKNQPGAAAPPISS